MDNNDNIHHHEHCNFYRRISWTAILAGALVGTGLGFLLHLYGLAIGLQAFNSSTDGTATTIAIGGLAGMVIGVIAAMFVAGYTAGYLGRRYSPMRNLGILYGFITWSVALILSAVLAHHAGNYVESYKNVTSHSQVVADNGTVAASNPETTNTNNKVTITKSDSANSGNTAVQPTTTLNNLTMTAYIVFGMFFIGALFSCIGACCGMSCKRED